MSATRRLSPAKMDVSGQATVSRRSEAEPGPVVAVRLTLGGSGGRFEGDAETEGFEFADVVTLLTVGVDAGVVVAGAEVVELGGVVLQEVPDDDEDGATYRDDGFLLAAAAGDTPVALS